MRDVVTLIGLAQTIYLESALIEYECTVQCCYNTVSFLQNSQNRHPMAHPRGPEIYVLLSLQCYINGLVQERRNFIANALELHLSCTNPSIYDIVIYWTAFWQHPTVLHSPGACGILTTLIIDIYGELHLVEWYHFGLLTARSWDWVLIGLCTCLWSIYLPIILFTLAWHQRSLKLDIFICYVYTCISISEGWTVVWHVQSSMISMERGWVKPTRPTSEWQVGVIAQIVYLFYLEL